MIGLTGMEQALVEYAANAVWQLPVLAAGAWLLVRVAKPGVAAQHRIWLGVLALAVLLPLRGAFFDPGESANWVAVAPARAGVAEHAASVSPNVFSASSFDQVGEPGGLVLGGQLAERQSVVGGLIGAAIAGLKFVAQARRVRLNATAAGWLMGLYLAVMLFGLLRLALAWGMARRLVRRSREISLTSRERLIVENCAQRLGVEMPEVRESVGVAGPVVVGAARPVLLWPSDFSGGLFMRQNEDEVMAALCHEMAHIRRRDYGRNLLCAAVAVPIKWHPVTYGVERQIRKTREMACDAMAAQAMESEMRYAKCLLRLAESMAVGGMTEQAGALGLFNGNVLEERVMRLMQEKTTMSARARVVRGVTGGAAMLATVALAAAFHVVPAMAQTNSPTTTSTEQHQVLLPPVDPVAPIAPVPAVPSGTEAALPAVPPVAKLPPLPALPALPAARMGAVAPIPPLPPLPALPALPGQVAPVAQPSPAPAPGPAPAPAPAPMPAPAPKAAPEPTVKSSAQQVHPLKTADGKSFAWVNGEERELTPAERKQVEKQLEDAQAKIAAATVKLNSPEFRKQIEDAQSKAMADAQKELNSPEFRAKMAEAQKQMAEADAKLNSPAFKAKMAEAQKQIAEAEARLQSPEFREKLQDEARQQALAEIDSAKFKQQMADAQKQVAEATARLNSPEFRKQMEEAAQASAKINSPAIQKQMAEAQKQLAAEMEKLKAEQEDTQKK